MGQHYLDHWKNAIAAVCLHSCWQMVTSTHLQQAAAEINLAPRCLQEVDTNDEGISNISFYHIPVIFLISHPEVKFLDCADIHRVICLAILQMHFSTGSPQPSSTRKSWLMKVT